jgi:hypothetical protein
MRGVLAGLKAGDPREKLINHRLAARPHRWQRLPTLAAVAHMSSPVQIEGKHKNWRLHTSAICPPAAEYLVLDVCGDV